MNKDVLLVDDDVLQLRMGENFLARLGITVHTCESGSAAIQSLEAGLRPDLVLTDLNMPDGTGIDLLRFVRATDEIHELPVMVVSGTADPSEIDAVHALGCDEFFAKPIDIKALLDRVAGNLGIPVRSARRYRTEVPGTLRGPDGDFDLTTLDMSTGGMLFVTDGRLAVGSEADVELCFPEASGLGTVVFSCTVVRRGLPPEGGSPCFSYGVRILVSSNARRRQMESFFSRL